MSLAAWFKGPGPNGFGFRSTAEQVTAHLDLTGRTYLLTGCNAGLGLESLRVLTLRGAHVLAAARTEDKARMAIAAAGVAPGRATPLVCDLGRPEQVRACAQSLRGSGVALDGILANAGIMALPQREVRHGLELQFLTNHVGHFLLVTALLERLTPAGRVVLVSSGAHFDAPADGIQFGNLDFARGYRPWAAYAHSKLANLLMARALGKRLAGTSSVAMAVHPGVIHTRLARHMGWVVNLALSLAGPVALKSLAQGTATQLYALAHPDAAAHQGAYLADVNPAPCSRHGQDDAMAERLWQVSEELAATLP